MYDKKNYIILIFCGLLSACVRSTPAPVIWGGKLKTRPNYIEKKYTKKQTYKKTTAEKGKIVIKKGDTAYSISKKYNISLENLLDINNLTYPYTLSVGQEIIINQPKNYIVKKGDTLYSIARQHNISLTSITSINKIKPPYKISEGRELIISSPVKTAKVTRSKDNYNQKVPSRSSSKFLKPTKGKIISTFGSKDSGLHNDGINIAAKRGTPVNSAENGIVVYSSNKIKGLGNIILIKHDNNWITTYAHLEKRLVKKGDTVARGFKIGTIGKTGSVTSPQLHFEIRKNTKPVNPNKYM